MRTDHWLMTWLHTPLADNPSIDAAALTAVMAPAIRAYHAWCATDGAAELLRFALRLTRDSDAATDAVSETFLDVRQRMVDCVDRARKGRSLPSFATVEQVARYHRIQVRLRIQRRWTHDRPALPLEEADLTCTPRPEHALEARRQALPLRFALCWTLSDIRSRAAHKDTDWWWRMLRHGLDIDCAGSLGSDRNDPTEITDRLRLRLAVTRSLRARITQWAAAQPGWEGVTVEIPADRPDTAAVSTALPDLRAAMKVAIDGMDLPDAEAAALRAVLVRGATVRNNLRGFSGPDPRTRMLALAEAVGAAVAA